MVFLGLATALSVLVTSVVPVPSAWAGDLAQVVSGTRRSRSLAPKLSSTMATSMWARNLSTVRRSSWRVTIPPPPSVARLNDVVFKVGDDAQLALPDDADSTVGGTPGQDVWVVPQTEQAGVPWVGWDTQSPSLVGAVDRGVTLEFLGHSGPGEFSLFLQNSGFEAPQVLWSLLSNSRKGFWVDLNTHTHANWTFTEPGVHQVGVRFSGKPRTVVTSAQTASSPLRWAMTPTWRRPKTPSGDPAAVNERPILDWRGGYGPSWG